MTQQVIRKRDVIILGQGLAGSALAWRLHWAGQRILVIDRGESVTASRIAAGLITPITGRRMTQDVGFDVLLDEAESFYREVEAATGQQLLDKEPSVRFFTNDEERTLFITERWPQLQADVRLIRNETGEPLGVEMLHAARLDVTQFLDATWDYFTERQELVTADVDPLTDIEVSGDGVRIASLNVSAAHLVFCQGHQTQQNPWFPGVPDGATKGEILVVRLPGRTDHRVTHMGLWLAPAHQQPTVAKDTENQFLVGATYDRVDLSGTITAAAREYLIRGLAEIVTEPIEVLDQVAAIRAGMKQRRPVVAVHSEHPQLAIINGLGSRGALLAPTCANELTAQMLSGFRSPNISVLAPSRIPVARSAPSPAPRKKLLTHLAHSIIRRVLKPGDTAIDATAGNGHDTLFLAQLVGETGIVIAIDRQQKAIASTEHRLSQEGVFHMTPHLGDHRTVLNRLAAEDVRAKAIMFNLGYLPGGDKTITTAAESTTAAVRAAQRLLSPGGVMTVIAYRGHIGGKEEATAIEDLISGGAPTGITADRINGDEANDTSPILFVWRNSGVK